MGKMSGFPCSVSMMTRKHFYIILMCIVTLALISLIGGPLGPRSSTEMSLATTQGWVSLTTVQNVQNSTQVTSLVHRESNTSMPFDKNAKRKEEFTYSITPGKVCGACELFVYVLTASGNVALRSRIRRTYANHSYYVNSAIKPEVVFILGLPVDDEASKSLRLENTIHQDILVGDFPDTYMTLTTKGMYAMHWVRDNRSKARYIMKVDDDVFVNMFAWIELIRSWAPNKGSCHFENACIAGYVWRNAPVGRTGKWATPVSLYAEAIYPYYCAGPNYLLTVTAMQKLLHTYPSVPFLPWEDIYWTGITGKKAGVQHFDVGSRGDPGEGVLSLVQAHVKDRLYVHHIQLDAFEKAWTSLVIDKAKKT